MRGRKPTPTNLKILKGTLRRPAGAEPQPDPAMTPCPAILQGSAADLWQQLAPVLFELGLLTSLDAQALTTTCAAYGRWVEAEAKLNEQGAVVKSANGFPILNPYLSVSRAASKQFAAGCEQFGLTPSARTRIKLKIDSKPRSANRGESACGAIVPTKADYITFSGA